METPVTCGKGHQLPVEYWGRACPYCTANPYKMTHQEAYCRMEYKRPTENEIVVIWNSRDGVSPFCAHIDGVEYQHINWQLDQYQRYWVPDVGDYIFMDTDYATWEKFEKDNVERNWDHPQYPMSQTFSTKEEALVELMKEFRPGEPMTIKVTQEIHDHFKTKAGDKAQSNATTRASIRPPYTGPVRFA